MKLYFVLIAFILVTTHFVACEDDNSTVVENGPSSLGNGADSPRPQDQPTKEESSEESVPEDETSSEDDR